jgi:NADH-quinone oxidoreductase subunit G
MEFLLINHPLDCPICDQGGECELQDQAMGYGRSVSRFTERKRVVKDKDIGPLVQTEMTRCIHCTRCVRELSGNIIDLCPVGALTNKPFRFAARAWELVARQSVAIHDGVGSCLYYHTRRGRVMRAVPRENEATNETWLSDRDRYSHLGLYSEDRILTPQLKEDGEWKSISWNEAVENLILALRDCVDKHGPDQIGVLMSPSATTEEYFLAQSLARQLGCHNIDHRLREQDFSDDQSRTLTPSFECSIADIEDCDAIVLAGCNPREEAPIIGHRIRQAWRKGAAISAVNPLDWPFTFDTSLDAVVAPQHMVSELAALAAAVEQSIGQAAPAKLRGLLDEAEITERHSALASRLSEAKRGLLLLGQFAMSHPDAACLRSLAAYVAGASGSALNLLPHGGNSKGAWRAGALPHRGPGGARAEVGMNAAEMMASPRKCYLLWGVEPGFDIDNPSRALAALAEAETVIVISPFALKGLRALADLLIPLAPHAESEGSVENLDGDRFGFSASGRLSGQARPGWKILRKLGGEIGLEGFSQVDLAEVQSDMQGVMATADFEPLEFELAATGATQGLYRIGEVPMYRVDALCRRSAPLQQTAQSASDFVGLNPGDAEALGLAEGDRARVRQGESQSEFDVIVSERVPAGGVWLRSATCETHMLEFAVAPVTVEVV